MNAPCKGCEKRELGCHSICPEYKKFAEYRIKMNEERRKRQEQCNLKRRRRTGWLKWKKDHMS